ncbi:uncharacterized protein LOC103510915 [Diaphorina citri]|uniref:Uncharacterized protein LOC103510915 n=1 Tax=Diaphorina citri TaxID=121845 RepID=A0A3Q0IWI7_DIACI|nr:uncharacterized protein LOC103510915 [Diaphorina citri]
MQNSKWFFLVICLVAIIKFHKAVPVPDSNNQIRTLKDSSLELDDLDLASSDEAGVSVKESSPAKSNPTRGKRTVGFLRTLFPNLSQVSIYLLLSINFMLGGNPCSSSPSNYLFGQNLLLLIFTSFQAGVSVKESSPAKSNPTRGKRTVGFLRTLFPNLSQIIDRKIQQITRILFRVIGRLVLRGGNGGGGGGDDDKEGRKISITLPTYPPSEEDEEDETEAPAGDSETEATDTDAEITTTPDSLSESPSLEGGDNQIAESQVITKIARKARDVSSLEQNKEPSQNSNDVDQNANNFDDKSSEDIDKPTKQEDDGKSKRVFFKFGGSGGASGNILFDLIRILNV